MDQQWTAWTVRAIVAPKLAYPVILGGPFLKSNKIVIDHEFGKVIAKDALYQLIPLVADRPEDVQVTPNPKERKTRQDLFRELQERMTRPKLFEELREQTKETLGTRAQIPTGHIVNTLRAQATCNSNVPSDQMLGTF